MELNTNLGAAHTILGLVKFWYGVFLAEIGQSKEGIRELKIAESLDPLALDVQAEIGLALYLARRYDEAEQVLQHILRQDPNMAAAHDHLLRIYAAREQIPEYIAEILKGSAGSEGAPREIDALAQQLRAAYESGGAQAFWRAYLEREQRTKATHPLGLARIYAHLGDQDRCIEILDKEYQQRDFMLVVWIKTDPQFDPIRSDPRFQGLLTKIGYPQ